MTRCTNSFPARKALIYLTLVTAVLALTALSGRAQTRSGADVFQKVSFKVTKTCTVEAGGEVTALVKNGVELSVTEDWDCDGVADGYDNCVGMPNPPQTDSDDNGIGDICEAATIVKTSAPVKSRPNVKAKKITAATNVKTKKVTSKASDRRSRLSAKKRSSREEKTKQKKVARNRGRR